jgi:transcriptional regulator with XRE-family HTH domain
MDFKKEIGRRIARCREDRVWTQTDLSRETGDLLSLKRISSYETGDRMPGPAEAVILAKALQVRPAYLLGVDDVQIPISAQEEQLIKNWRTLNEKDRMVLYRHVESLAMQNRDPAPNFKVEQAFATPRRPKALPSNK